MSIASLASVCLAAMTNGFCVCALGGDCVWNLVSTAAVKGGPDFGPSILLFSTRNSC